MRTTTIVVIAAEIAARRMTVNQEALITGHPEL
jgi:hypothetical protein